MKCQPIKAKLSFHEIGFDVPKTMATRKYKFPKYSFLGVTKPDCR